jgi:hypothetical protein
MLSPLSVGILTTLSALAAPPEPASAAGDRPTIGVVGLHHSALDEADQQRAIAALVAAVEASGRFDGAPVPEVAGALGGRENVVLEEGLLKTARQSLANGRTAAAQASWDEARSWLAAAASDYERVMPGANTTDDLWELFVLEGSTWLLQDAPDEAAAKASFARSVALNPQKPADPALYPPTVTDVYAAVQADLGGKLASVAFSGTGKLWVDGTERGALPSTVAGLAPGVHYALARGSGRQGAIRFELPVGGGPAITLPAGPPFLGEPAETNANRASQIAAIYSSLGKRSDGLEYVLVGGVEGGVLHLQLFDTARSVFSKAVELPFADDSDDEAVAAVPLLLPIVNATGVFTATAPSPAALSIADNVALAGLLTQPPPPSIPIGPDLPPPVVKKSKLPLVLGIVGGVVVAGGATTAVVLLSGPGPEQTGTVIVNF